MKKIKGIISLFLTAIMVLGMSLTAVADEGDQNKNHMPVATDAKTVSVTGIKGTDTDNDGAVTVTAYKVVQANYDPARGFTGYSWTAGTKYLDKEEKELTEEEKNAGYTARKLFIDVPVQNSTDTVKTLNIDEDAIVALANLANGRDLEPGIPMTIKDGNDKTTYSAELTAGSYVVLVRNSDDVIYNPMLVGVYYTAAGSGDSNHLITDASLNADTAKWTLLAQNGFAKSSKPGLTKEIVNPGANGNDHGDDVAIGDTVSFKITTTMPSYSDQYYGVDKNPIFRIKDEISTEKGVNTGLTYIPTSITVYAKAVEEGNKILPTESVKDKDGTTVTKTNYTVYTIIPPADGVGTSTTGSVTESATNFVISFTGDYIKEHPTTDIIVTYDATINANAGINYNANVNKATLEYSHNPYEVKDVESIDDTTYHYTFGIDALLYGADSYMTRELFKLNENGTATVDGETVTVTNGLNGAKFQLSKKVVTENASGEEVVNYIPVGTPVASDEKEGTDVDGWLSFTGLDAGEYKLVETEAPKGYSLDPKGHTVVITAHYYKGDETLSQEQVDAGVIVEKGRLKDYSIEIDGEATTTYSATYKSTNGTVVTTIDRTETSVTGIKNTKLAQLPSTGGIGTTIFTIGGCAIMIVAAALFFATRRKSQK